DVADDKRHIENQIPRSPVLVSFAIYGEPETHIVYIRNFVFGGQKGAYWCKRITSLSFVPGTAAFQLKRTFRHVVMQHIPGYIIKCIGGIHITRLFADYYAKFNFPVGFR